MGFGVLRVLLTILSYVLPQKGFFRSQKKLDLSLSSTPVSPLVMNRDLRGSWIR